MQGGFELGEHVPMRSRRCVCAALTETHLVSCWLHHWIILGAERTEEGEEDNFSFRLLAASSNMHLHPESREVAVNQFHSLL